MKIEEEEESLLSLHVNLEISLVFQVAQIVEEELKAIFYMI